LSMGGSKAPILCGRNVVLWEIFSKLFIPLVNLMLTSCSLALIENGAWLVYQIMDLIETKSFTSMMSTIIKLASARLRSCSLKSRPEFRG